MTNIDHIHMFLLCETPQAWIDQAQKDIPLLLTDHANCELKAAQTAQSIMWKYGLKFDPLNQKANPKKSAVAQINSSCRYPDNFALLNKMSRLAREELRHFEQVIALMKKRGIDYYQIDAANYAGQLRQQARTSEPHKLIDILIVGAIIEARSCERFAKLAPYLDDELKQFYLSLLKSEARHYQDYLELAETAAGHFSQSHTLISVDERVSELLLIEKDLVESEATQFRFHSGPLSA
ncbi:MAG: tRNA-(ms[2]io[6]A)-hydroxylase [Cellvibrionaceae bacterium]|jgi:tRNA-(ms[2]io[6]A)-hydroxylase